eukprot:1562260-Pyramimonas_sp.AAC.1
MALKVKMDVVDVKNAFCQSDRVQRTGGEISVESCDGLPLEPGSLIQLVVNLCGLGGAPLAWRRTVVKYLTENGFARALLRPRRHVK